MEVAKRILQLREERQWSEYRLAKEAGISQSTLCNLSSRGNNPSVYTLEKIAGAFGLSLAQFFNTEDENIAITVEQKQLLAYWNCLDKLQKVKVLSYMKGMLEQ